jgi:hypothetical protein
LQPFATQLLLDAYLADIATRDSVICHLRQNWPKAQYLLRDVDAEDTCPAIARVAYIRQKAKTMKVQKYDIVGDIHGGRLYE